ncbi:MAG: DsbA family protein [Rhodospirillales bacterium]|jgi:protein-disulfide isomerase|nr:DsbA family protein [Rhodospirillales bacterium]
MTWVAGGSAFAADTDGLLPEMALGSADAPVTIHEYSSLTCGHCANFHRETLPEIKKAYIDTGKVRFVFRDFPLDNLAFAAALLPHCAGPQRYFGFLEVLFRTQENWAGSKDPLSELKKVARLGGMSADDFDACLNNQALFVAIRDRATADSKTYDIEATPTFRIGDDLLVGGQGYEVFREAIENALKAAQ